MHAFIRSFKLHMYRLEKDGCGLGGLGMMRLL
jgi:hypothetical protein